MNKKELIQLPNLVGKIFVIIGRSGSGKDTIYNLIMKQIDLQPIILYTTRPMRSGEVNGREYHFVNNFSGRNIIESRVYHTVNGIWEYATIDDGNINLDINSYITINTIDGFKKIRSYFGDIVIPIYISLDSEVLFERAYNRESSLTNPDYHELCRRFISDSKDFSNVSRDILENTFINNNKDKCVEDIIKFIKEEIRK